MLWLIVFGMDYDIFLSGERVGVYFSGIDIIEVVMVYWMNKFVLFFVVGEDVLFWV